MRLSYMITTIGGGLLNLIKLNFSIIKKIGQPRAKSIPILIVTDSIPDMLK
jgi:hypothetical protein